MTTPETEVVEEAAVAPVGMREAELIEIKRINRTGGTQIRAAINQKKVDEYIEAKKLGSQFPPIHVFYDGSEYWPDDGFHRIAADEQLGKSHTLAIVDPGTLRDAIFQATGANGNHGLERTDEDKKRAVWTLLRDDEWRAMTDRAIAVHVHVSPGFVGDQRRAYLATVPGAQSDSNVRTDRRGRKIDTTNIGGKKKEAPAAAPATPARAGASWPADNTPSDKKLAAGDWVRTNSGHEGEVMGISGRNIAVRTGNGERDYLATQLTKIPKPTGPRLPPPAQAHDFMRQTLTSLYDQHARHNGWVPQMNVKLFEAPALEGAGLIACCKRRGPSGAPIRWWQITADGIAVLGREPLALVPEPSVDEYPAGTPYEPASAGAAPAPAPASPDAPTSPPAPPAATEPVVVTLTLRPAGVPDQPRAATAVVKHGEKVDMKNVVFNDAAELGAAILAAEAQFTR